MIEGIPRLAGVALAGMAMLVTPSAAQDSDRPLQAGPPGIALPRQCPSDSELSAAVTAFNDPAAFRLHDGTVWPVGKSMDATLAVYGGSLRIQGTVHGSVIVLNGSLRLDPTGHVDGSITVYGGHITIGAGAMHVGRRNECDEPVPLVRMPDGTVAIRPRTRSFTELTSAAAIDIGPFHATPHLDAGTYNRVEGLPVEIGGALSVQPWPATVATLTAYGIARTASSIGPDRSGVGWQLEGSIVHKGPRPVRFSVSGGSQIVPTVDRPYVSVESGLGTFLFREDYHDWYQSKGITFGASVAATPHLAFDALVTFDRQTTVRAVDALSILKSDEAWRPNPLIDDGKYTTIGLGATWDYRDDPNIPTSGWYLQTALTHVTGNELTPVSLPTSIRNPLPTSGYDETELRFDARAYLSLTSTLRAHVRAFGSGWLGGDPLSVQRRVAMGGADPLMGYTFRHVNCDRRRRPDPATPALCDRELVLQAELHRTISLDLSTRIGGYTIGLRHPDLVVLADVGTAWLAGDSAGRVPSNRIQRLSEWKPDVGVGIQGRQFGIYVVKPLADHEGVRLLLRLISHRF